MERLRELLIFVAAIVMSVGLFSISNRRVEAETACDTECLNEKINALTKRVVALEAKLSGGVKKTAKVSAKISFFPVSGGSATGGDWTEVAGSAFYFDQSLYGGVEAVTWEGWVEEGSGRARLFDVTNGRAVDGSEVSVSAPGRASFYSQPLAIWRGQNKYVIQVMNANIQKVTISTPRLRILSK